MFYIHFWTKDGRLERVPHDTIEEAEKAAWAWERSERARMNPENKVGGFPGAARNKMITVITDEDNNVCDVNFFGSNFIWDLNHNKYIMNDNYWATQFEAASRGLEPGKVPCLPDCFNCRTRLDMDGNLVAVSSIDEPLKLSRDDGILLLFSQGKTRKEISDSSGISYQTVCRVIRESKVRV